MLVIEVRSKTKIGIIISIISKSALRIIFEDLYAFIECLDYKSIIMMLNFYVFYLYHLL